MGCSCFDPAVKIKSNISSNNIIYFNKAEEKKTEDEEEKNFQDFLKSFKAKIIAEHSNISSSCLSFSDDDKEDSKRAS